MIAKLIAKLELVKKSEFAMRHQKHTPIIEKTKMILLNKLGKLVGRNEADIIYSRLLNEEIATIIEDYE